MIQRNGQSIIEVLVGIALAAVFIVGAVSLIAPALRTNTQVAQIQTKTELAKELLDNLRSWSAGNWNGVLALATGTSKVYYLNASTSPFTIVGTGTSTEAVVISTTTYVRYFYLADVYRDGGGNATATASGNSYDPSTKLVTIIVNASTTVNPGATTTLTFFLTRANNNTINQSSWIGASNLATPITIVSTTYATSSNVAITATGTIILATPSGGTCTL